MRGREGDLKKNCEMNRRVKYKSQMEEEEPEVEWHWYANDRWALHIGDHTTWYYVIDGERLTISQKKIINSKNKKRRNL